MNNEFIFLAMICVFFVFLGGRAVADHEGSKQSENLRASSENCGEVAKLVCAFMEGCRVGYRECKIKMTSVCWTELNNKLVSLAGDFRCSKWVYVLNPFDGPIECDLGPPRRDSHQIAAKGILLEQLRRNQTQGSDKTTNGK